MKDIHIVQTDKSRQLERITKLLEVLRKNQTGSFQKAENGQYKILDKKTHYYLNDLDRAYLEISVEKAKEDPKLLPACCDVISLRNWARDNYKFSYQTRETQQKIELAVFALVGEFQANGLTESIGDIIKDLINLLKAPGSKIIK